MTDITRQALDVALCNGAVLAGVATLDTLAGGPPSTDLSYILEGARSAVTFALPLDQDLIESFLSKNKRLAHEKDNILVNTLSSGVSLNLAKYLDQKGHPSTAVAVNNVYRAESPGGLFDMIPDLSLRYLAAASGLGHLGLSGNLITKEYGAAVILGATVTTAELTPTKPLPAEDSYCDGCKLCMAACASGQMDPEEITTVTMGGRKHSYSKRRTYLRCEFVCGGFTGLPSSGKWSTWAPGRFNIPDNDDEFRQAIIPGLKAYGQRPPLTGGFPHILMHQNLNLTCGHCQLICHPDKEVRKKRYKTLIESGVVIQKEDGSLEATTPEEADEYINSLPAEKQGWYCNT